MREIASDLNKFDIFQNKLKLVLDKVQKSENTSENTSAHVKKLEIRTKGYFDVLEERIHDVNLINDKI